MVRLEGALRGGAHGSLALIGRRVALSSGLLQDRGLVVAITPLRRRVVVLGRRSSVLSWWRVATWLWVASWWWVAARGRGILTGGRVLALVRGVGNCGRVRRHDQVRLTTGKQVFLNIKILIFLKNSFRQSLKKNCAESFYIHGQLLKRPLLIHPSPRVLESF
jgi:hypothetical protein